MSLIKKLHNKQATETKMISTSIKIPQVMDEIISDLAVFFDSTKQEVILDLLSDAIDNYKAEEKKLLEQQENEIDGDENRSITNQENIAINHNYFLLNTCKRYSIDDHYFMINNGYAAAFDDGYKQQIERIKKGDVVFLYANGKGISGYGIASGQTIKIEHDGVPENCYYQVLEDYQLLDTPLKAKDIRDICSRTPVFLKTLSKINKKDGQIIYNNLNN